MSKKTASFQFGIQNVDILGILHFLNLFIPVEFENGIVSGEINS